MVVVASPVRITMHTYSYGFACGSRFDAADDGQ